MLIRRGLFLTSLRPVRGFSIIQLMICRRLEGQNMKRIAGPFFIAAAAALVATASAAAPVEVSSPISQPTASTNRVRLVCDQDCRCWRTGYAQRGHGWKIDDREFQDPNYCPAGGHYNCYYRAGPGTGLSFDSRLPVRSFPFPF